MEGFPLDAIDGKKDGFSLGAINGMEDRIVLIIMEEDRVGTADGSSVGMTFGSSVGVIVDDREGRELVNDNSDGDEDGYTLGHSEGIRDRTSLGTKDSNDDGSSLEECDGCMDG